MAMLFFIAVLKQLHIFSILSIFINMSNKIGSNFVVLVFVVVCPDSRVSGLGFFFL